MKGTKRATKCKPTMKSMKIMKGNGKIVMDIQSTIMRELL